MNSPVLFWFPKPPRKCSSMHLEVQPQCKWLLINPTQRKICIPIAGVDPRQRGALPWDTFGSQRSPDLTSLHMLVEQHGWLHAWIAFSGHKGPNHVYTEVSYNHWCCLVTLRRHLKHAKGLNMIGHTRFQPDKQSFCLASLPSPSFI